MNISCSRVLVFSLFRGTVLILLIAEKPLSQSAVAIGSTSPRTSSFERAGKSRHRYGVLSRNFAKSLLEPSFTWVDVDRNALNSLHSSQTSPLSSS